MLNIRHMSMHFNIIALLLTTRCIFKLVSPLKDTNVYSTLPHKKYIYLCKSTKDTFLDTFKVFSAYVLAMNSSFIYFGTEQKYTFHLTCSIRNTGEDYITTIIWREKYI